MKSKFELNEKVKVKFFAACAGDIVKQIGIVENIIDEGEGNEYGIQIQYAGRSKKYLVYFKENEIEKLK